jgi:hypothetical protein
MAKEQLAAPKDVTPEVKAKRQALMKKLWEYRQWHHEVILQETKAALPAGTLESWASSGSVTLSSDIDINLKGKATERAVPAFNAIFKSSKQLPEHRFDRESGVVYDVNVYAVDFMHAFGGVVRDGKKITVKEGARSDRAEGGIAGADQARVDRRRQQEAALFKVRLYMTQAQWDSFTESVQRGDPDPDGWSHVFMRVQARFLTYFAELAEQIAGDAERADAVVDAAGQTGMQQLESRAYAVAGHAEDEHEHQARGADVLVAASNRIYERKLEGVAAKRAELRALVAEYERAEAPARPGLERRIDVLLVALRNLVAEASLYANEASITDATAHHGVVGLQGGAEINQTKAEGMNAVHEHLGDSLKEIARHGLGDDANFGEAAFKAGKYLFRLGDAARNMGYGYIWGVQMLYDAGRVLSGEIKSRAETGELDAAAAATTAMRELFGGDLTLAELTGLVTETGADVTREYQAELEAEEEAAGTEAGSDAVAGTLGHTTGKKGSVNEHVLNMDMVHPLDRAARRESELAEAERLGTLSDFAFRMTPAELARFEAVVAENKQRAAAS